MCFQCLLYVRVLGGYIKLCSNKVWNTLFNPKSYFFFSLKTHQKTWLRVEAKAKNESAGSERWPCGGARGVGAGKHDQQRLRDSKSGGPPGSALSRVRLLTFQVLPTDGAFGPRVLCPWSSPLPSHSPKFCINRNTTLNFPKSLYSSKLLCPRSEHRLYH